MARPHGVERMLVLFVAPSASLAPHTCLAAPAPGMESAQALSRGEVLGMLRFGADRIFKNDSVRPLGCTAPGRMPAGMRQTPTAPHVRSGGLCPILGAGRLKVQSWGPLPAAAALPIQPPARLCVPHCRAACLLVGLPAHATSPGATLGLPFPSMSEPLVLLCRGACPQTLSWTPSLTAAAHGRRQL